jgi:ankyrin repeat protein
MAQSNPFLLAAENSSNLLPLLRSNTSVASKQDEHGYSLLHAAASYHHIDLLRSLVNEFHVDVNLKDEDGETCLFVTETVPIAQCLVDELHVDVDLRNHEGMTAAEKIAHEGDFPEVAAYLQSVGGGQTNGSAIVREAFESPSTHPPPLPPNVTVNVGTLADPPLDDDSQEPDPEFKRRIEALAAKDNFHSEEVQRELRDLIADAIRGVGDNRDVRRRVN